MKLTNIQSKLVWIIILLLPYILLYVVSKYILVDVYMPKWTVDNLYLYDWILVVIFVLLNKKHIAVAVSVGNALGIVLGQVIGDIILSKNLEKITISMDEGQKHFLQTHYGVPIWLLSIATAIVVVVAINHIKERCVAR
jgi:hypothetical protein